MVKKQAYKSYMAPTTEVIMGETRSNLLDWSADKAVGGNNTPDAKEDLGWEEEEENIWED